MSGFPIVVGDPHRAQETPNLRYWVHLNAPGWNVIGAGEPALPIIDAYDLNEDGTIANRRLSFDAKPFIDPKYPGLCDGIKADQQGNIWTGALGGICVISPISQITRYT